jgi:hypothetical protein
MRKAVGAGNHKTAVAMVRTVDGLWDARGGHNPTVAATTSNKRNGNAGSKSGPPSGSDFFSFQNPGNGCVQVSQLLWQQRTKVHFPVFLV